MFNVNSGGITTNNALKNKWGHDTELKPFNKGQHSEFPQKDVVIGLVIIGEDGKVRRFGDPPNVADPIFGDFDPFDLLDPSKLKNNPKIDPKTGEYKKPSNKDNLGCLDFAKNSKNMKRSYDPETGKITYTPKDDFNCTYSKVVENEDGSFSVTYSRDGETVDYNKDGSVKEKPDYSDIEALKKEEIREKTNKPFQIMV